MESRFKNFVGTDYKIFDSSRRGVLQVLLNQYEVKKEVADILVKRAREVEIKIII